MPRAAFHRVTRRIIGRAGAWWRSGGRANAAPDLHLQVRLSPEALLLLGQNRGEIVEKNGSVRQPLFLSDSVLPLPFFSQEGVALCQLIEELASLLLLLLIELEPLCQSHQIRIGRNRGRRGR